MKFNDLGVTFKYLLVNERDKKFGLTVNSVGFQPIAPNTLYPSTEHPKGYYFDPNKGRVLSEYQLLYISKGKGSFCSDTIKKRNIHKGQFIILFPGQWHTYCPDLETGWNEYYIGFEGEIFDRIVQQGFISKENQIMDVGFNEVFVDLFNTSIKVAKDELKSSQQYLSGIVFHLIGMILFYSQNRELESNEFGQIIERAKMIMLENVNNKIDVQELANNLGTSYSWFRKTFKEYTGFAPAHYFQELKLRKAKELLAETTIPIKEIAYDLNFCSYEYFLSFFKKNVGCTPLEYRK